VSQEKAVDDRPGYSHFLSRDDLLEAYGDNALLLYVAQLKLDVDDIDSFAATWLTDGSGDKKCDLVALTDGGDVLVIAQGYFSTKEVAAAPANKASDLNTAVTWLLSGPLEALPEVLRGAALEARSAIASGTVRELQLWYVHNLPESQNVREELDQVIKTADGLLAREFPEAQVDVSAQEVGSGTLEQEYRDRQQTILVTDQVVFDVPNGISFGGDNWDAYATVIPVSQLRDLWKKHKTKLMSPNIRDYLGLVKKRGNINYGIKETVKSEPTNFAIYNNGITVLVNDFAVEQSDTGARLIVDGIGIVNGGQTTGSIGGIGDPEFVGLDDAKVMARFVKCSDAEVLNQIVRFNNTQHKIEATDFRSGTPVQERLRREFESVPDADYRGGRRGGTQDAIERKRSLLADSSVAQAIAAFHGDPNLAYNDTRKIWDDDATYSGIFRDTLSARHIVFAHGLLKAVEHAKQQLLKMPELERTDMQKRHIQFFSARGSTVALASAIGASIETILNRAVADRYALRFAANVSPIAAQEAWQPVVDQLVFFTNTTLTDATDQGLKSRERVEKAMDNFGAMVGATREANPASMDELASSVIEDAIASSPQLSGDVETKDKK
jgi:hypothetical protein